MSVHSDCRYTSRQIHFHDSVYNNCFSLPTDSKGVTNAVAELAEALQAQALGSRHNVDTDRQTCAEMVRKLCKNAAEMPWDHKCTLNVWQTVYTRGRQSTRLESSLHIWKTVYKPALTRGKHTGALMKHCSSFGKSMMAPGDWLELSIKVEGGKGVDTLLHCFAHGWMAQDAPNLRCLHVLNRHTCYMHLHCD